MYNDVTEWVTAYVMKGTEVMTIKTRKVCNQWRGFNPLGNQDQPPLTLYWNGKQQFDHGLSFLFHKNKYFTKDIMLQTWILTGSLHTLHFSSFCWSAHYRKKRSSVWSQHTFSFLWREYIELIVSIAHYGLKLVSNLYQPFPETFVVDRGHVPPALTRLDEWPHVCSVGVIANPTVLFPTYEINTILNVK